MIWRIVVMKRNRAYTFQFVGLILSVALLLVGRKPWTSVGPDG